MFHPIFAVNNSALTLYTTFLKALNCRWNEYTERWLHCTLLLMRISIIVTNIRSLTCTFYLAQSSDNRGFG